MVEFVWEKNVGFSCTSFMGSCGFKRFAPSCFQKRRLVIPKKIFPPPKRRDEGTSQGLFPHPPKTQKLHPPIKKEPTKNLRKSVWFNDVGGSFWLPRGFITFSKLDLVNFSLSNHQQNPATHQKKRQETPHQTMAMTGRKIWGLHMY